MNERISLEEAVERALRAAGPRGAEQLGAGQLGAEQLGAGEALERVLAEDVRYTTALPPFDYAAMDGYAIAGAADEDATFRVSGESRAGVPAVGLAGAGEAVAISTGAALPAGTDTVVPWEQVERVGDSVRLRAAAQLGQHIRRAGEDAAAGALAVAKGTRLGPRHLAALAVAERAVVSVSRRPRVLLAITGDELRDAGAADGHGLIVDSNGPMLAALATRAGATVVRVRVPDSADALRAFLDEAASSAKLVATVGGAADGEHDHVARVLGELGAETLFRGVAIKPGKPVGLARLRGIPILTLPGNPGSAYVTFALLGLPLLRALTGETHPVRRVRARLAAPLRAPADRCAIHYGALDVRESTIYFVPARNAASGSVPGVATASALALVPAGASLAAEALIDAIDLDVA